MLTSVESIDTHISTAQWENINNRINHFLDYVTTHPDAKVIYHKSDTRLRIHTYAYYLTETKSRSQARGYHCFSKKPKLPIKSDDSPPKHNHHVLFPRKVIDAVMSSTQESETCGGYINAKEALQICKTAI